MLNEGFIETQDELQLFFRRVGKGPENVVIPNGMYLLEDFQQFADSRTLIFYDVRNRGLSDSVSDPAKLAAGIHQDVEDLEAVREHFKLDKLQLIGHSYIGLMVALYAQKYPHRVNRLILIGPTQPDAGKQYPAHMTGADGKVAEVFSRIAQIQKQRPEDPEEACKQFWSVLREIFVADSKDVDKITWGRCELPNERNFMRYWTEYIVPSIQSIHLTAADLSMVKAPVLIIHGTKDRSTPYGGALDWASFLPDARLLTVENAAHAPWIESPEIVSRAISDFLK